MLRIQQNPLIINETEEGGEKIKCDSSLNDRDHLYGSSDLQDLPASLLRRDNFMSSVQGLPPLQKTAYKEEEDEESFCQEGRLERSTLNVPHLILKKCNLNDRLEDTYVGSQQQVISIATSQHERPNQRYEGPNIKHQAGQQLTESETTYRPQSCFIQVSSSIVYEAQVKEAIYNSYDNEHEYHCEEERNQKRLLIGTQDAQHGHHRINHQKMIQGNDFQETICTPSIRKVKSITQSQGNLILEEGTHRSSTKKNDMVCQYCYEPLNYNKKQSYKKAKVKHVINSRRLRESEDKQDRRNLLTVSQMHIGNNKPSPINNQLVLVDSSLAEEDYDKINSIENSFRYLNPNNMTKSLCQSKYQKASILKDNTKKRFVQRSQTSQVYGRYDSLGKRKWLVVQNLIKSIKFLNQAPVRNLESPDEIIDEISRHQLKINKAQNQLTMSYSSQNPMPNNYKTQAIKDFRKESQFFANIEKYDHTAFDLLIDSQALRIKSYRGGEEDIKNIENEVQNDPRKYMRERTDPEHLINKKNQNGQTPLYVAALNGHLKVVEYLLEQGADPHITVKVDRNINETILDVSIRWSHLQLVQYLLSKVAWSSQEVGSAYKVCLNGCNAAIKDMFKGYLVQIKQKDGSKLRCLCCFFWRSSNQ